MGKTYRFWREFESVKAVVDGQPLKHVVYHSTTGFEFGHGGSGPADLALAILADYFGEEYDPREIRMIDGPPPLSWQLHQMFKRHFLAGLEGHGPHEILGDEIEEWLGATRGDADGAATS